MSSVRAADAAAAAAAVDCEPLLTFELPCPGLRDTNTRLNEMTPLLHLGTIADSKTTFKPDDFVI